MKINIEERIKYFLENAEYLDKRAYFTVDGEGKIKRKKMNYSFPAIFFCEDDIFFKNILEIEKDKRERTKIKKIDRLSNLEMDRLSENLIKLVIKGELDFAKRYAKELAMRDKEYFIKTLFNLSLMDNLSFDKPLMALAMREYISRFGWNDEVGYLVMSYFTKQRYDINQLEFIKPEEEMCRIEPRTVSQLAYKKVLDSYEYTNKSKYRAILIKDIEKTDFIEESELEKILKRGIEVL